MVEDSQLEAKLAEDILSKHASCPEITWVKNGFEALEHLADSTTLEIDLILLDIQMPLMDGIETLTKIRQLATGSYVPVVMFSSSNLPSDIQRSYCMGANAYVQKQIDYDAQVHSLMTTLSFWLTCSHSS